MTNSGELHARKINNVRVTHSIRSLNCASIHLDLIEPSGKDKRASKWDHCFKQSDCLPES